MLTDKEQEQLENLLFIQQATNRHIEIHVEGYTSSCMVHLTDKIYDPKTDSFPEDALVKELINTAIKHLENKKNDKNSPNS